MNYKTCLAEDQIITVYVTHQACGCTVLVVSSHVPNRLCFCCHLAAFKASAILSIFYFSACCCFYYLYFPFTSYYHYDPSMAAFSCQVPIVLLSGVSQSTKAYLYLRLSPTKHSNLVSPPSLQSSASPI